MNKKPSSSQHQSPDSSKSQPKRYDSLTGGSGSVDGEKVGIALALQFRDKIRDVTTEVEASKDDDESKDGSWSVVDGVEVKDDDKEGGALPVVPDVDTEYDTEEEEEEGEGGVKKKRGEMAEHESVRGTVVDMGLRSKNDRRMGGPERHTGHDGKPTHDNELLREDDVTMVTPRRQYRGTLVLTQNYLYFFRSFASEEGLVEDNQSGGNGKSLQFIKDEETVRAEENASDGFSRERWVLANVSGGFPRRYRLRNTAMEVHFRLGKKRSMFIDFGRRKEDTSRRDDFLFKLLTRVPKGAWRQWPRLSSEWLIRGYRITEAWQRREMSNYDYLMALNTIAGRSFNDLSQYPVFPWILSNYTSPTIDLKDPKNYRDLTKPMGAQNEERLGEFLERYEAFQDPNIPKFMYGSHYSTAAGVVLHYLVRLQPYATLHQEMQGGDFDVADRLFSSIPRSWRMNTSDLSEVKELTPEWFTLPDFLRNLNDFDMGETQDGGKVGDVELPPWAPTAEDFIRIQREALESEYVSQNLHHWVDLIFGYKQRGPAAVEAKNVFFYLTYDGAVDVAQIEDEALRRATEMQIAYFGQCPLQLFKRAHPARDPCPVIYRPLSSLLRQGLTVPVEATSGPEQRMGRELPEPVSVHEADNYIIYVKVLRNRIITVNENGVVSSYSWNCLLRMLERERISLPAPDGSDAALGWPGIEAQPPPLLTIPPTTLPPPLNTTPSGRAAPPLYNLALSANECVSPNTPYYSAGGAAQGGGASPRRDKIGGSSSIMASSNLSPRHGSSPTRARRSHEDLSPRVATRDVKIQILKLIVERDRTAIESVPRLPQPVFTDRGSRGGKAFPIHISQTGRFIFGGGDHLGSIHVIEMDVLEGRITGETSLQGHSGAVTCFASGELEETGMELVVTGSEDCLGMVWCMQRINAKTKKPYLFKRPDHILYGHVGPVVSCALSVSLGIAVTVSAKEMLIHKIDTGGLIRRISLPSSLSSRGLCLRHCALSDEGFIVVSMNGPPGGGHHEGSRVQVWTINGNVVVERESRLTINRLKIMGRHDVVMAVSKEGAVEFLDLFDLNLVGSYRLDWGYGPGGAPQGRTPTELVCCDAGPDVATPVLLAGGTSEGSLVVVGLPLIHHLRDLESARGLAETLLNVPIKLYKDTVAVVTNTFGKVSYRRRVERIKAGVVREALYSYDGANGLLGWS